MRIISYKDPEQHERVVEAVKQYALEKLVPKLKPKLVVLYGSFARGDYGPGSDINLLIVAEDVPKTYWDRWSLAYEIVEGFPIDPHIYTPNEFVEMVEEGRTTALDALTEGKTIYADLSFQQQINKLLEKALKTRTKHKNMWIPKNLLQKLKGKNHHSP